MRRLVSSWIAAAVVLTFAVAARDARALDDRSAKACPSCEQGTGGGAVLVADDGDDPMEGIPEKWRKALKERLEKLPVERREAILKRIRSLRPEQRQALLERFMNRSKYAAGEGKKPAKAEKKQAERGEFDRAREMFESYVRKNPDALKDAGKLFDLARKHFEDMPQAQREQLKRFLQLDPERRRAALEHFRALADRGDHARDGKKHGKKGGKDHAKDGKKHGKKHGKDEARRGDRGPGGPFFRRLPPQVRERIHKFFQSLPPEARERIHRFHDQMQRHMQERFQGRDGKRGRPGAHDGKRGRPGARDGRRPGPDQFREALRRHIQEMMKERHGGEAKKGHKDGKKGGKRGHKKHHDDIAAM